MKLPFPRPAFWMTLCFLAVSLVFFLSAFRQWLDTGRLSGARGDALLTVVVAGAFVLGAFTWFCIQLGDKYFFVVWGETFKKKIIVPAGQTLSVGPLSGMEDKFLICGLSCRVASPSGPTMQPFRVYLATPPIPRVLLHFQVLRIEDGRHICIYHANIDCVLEVPWDNRDEVREPFAVWIDRMAPSDKCYVRLTFVRITGLKGLREEDLRGAHEHSPIEVRLKLSAGLKWADARRWNEVRIGAAESVVESEALVDAGL